MDQEVSNADSHPPKPSYPLSTRGERKRPRMPRFGLANPRTGRGQRWITEKLKEFRDSIERELATLKGTEAQGLIYGALAQSAARHEWVAATVAHWLHSEGAAAPFKERLAAMALISRATNARDAVLAKLGLQTSAMADTGGSVWDSLEVDDASTTEIPSDDETTDKEVRLDA